MIASLPSPHEPVPARLLSVHRAGSELYLRYRIGEAGMESQ
jgi:hypothetical protein